MKVIYCFFVLIIFFTGNIFSQCDSVFTPVANEALRFAKTEINTNGIDKKTIQRITNSLFFTFTDSVSISNINLCFAINFYDDLYQDTLDENTKNQIAEISLFYLEESRKSISPSSKTKLSKLDRAVGFIYDKVKQPDKAIFYLSRATRIDKKDVGLYRQIAEQYLKKNQLDSCSQMLIMSYRANPKDTIYDYQNKTKYEAVADFFYWEAYAWWGTLQNPMLNKAISYYKKVITSNKHNQYEILNKIAVCYNLLDSSMSAISYYKKLVELGKDTNNANLRIIASLYDKIGQKENSILYYQRAEKMGLLDANEYENIGDYFYNISEFQIALKYYLLAEPIFRSNIEYLGDSLLISNLYSDIGRCYTLLDKRYDANVYFQKALDYIGRTETFWHQLRKKELEINKVLMANDGWIVITDNSNTSLGENEIYLIQKEKIKSNQSQVVRCWMMNKIIPITKTVNEQREAMIKERKAKYLGTDGYDKYDHSLALREFDCNNNSLRTLRSIDYDENGKVLESLESGEKTEWNDVVPGSVGEAWLEFICGLKKGN